MPCHKLKSQQLGELFFNFWEKSESTTSMELLLSFFLQCLRDSKQDGRVSFLKSITDRKRLFYRYVGILLITQTPIAT